MWVKPARGSQDGAEPLKAMQFNSRSLLQFLSLLDRTLFYYPCLPEGEIRVHASVHTASTRGHTAPPRQVLTQHSGFKALCACLKSSEGSVSFPSWTGSHPLWSFLSPREWSLMATFLTPVWTTSRFSHSCFPVCNWIPGSFFLKAYQNQTP